MKSGAELLGDSKFSDFEDIFKTVKTTMLMFMMIEAYMGAPVDNKDNATHIAEFKTGTAKPFWSDVRVPAGLEELCAANAVK